MKTRSLLRFFPLLAFLANKDLPSPNAIRDIGGFKGNPEYHPKHTKFKGWMREKKRSKFNKNK